MAAGVPLKAAGSDSVSIDPLGLFTGVVVQITSANQGTQVERETVARGVQEQLANIGGHSTDGNNENGAG